MVSTSGGDRSQTSRVGCRAIAGTSSRRAGGDGGGGGARSSADGRFSRGSVLRGGGGGGAEVGWEGDVVLGGAGLGVEALDGIMLGLFTSLWRGGAWDIR